MKNTFLALVNKKFGVIFEISFKFDLIRYTITKGVDIYPSSPPRLDETQGSEVGSAKHIWVIFHLFRLFNSPPDIILIIFWVTWHGISARYGADIKESR